jgi:hypothetical protein
LVRSHVGFEDVCTLGDFEVGSGNDEIGGEGTAGYFVAFIAVTYGLRILVGAMVVCERTTNLLCGLAGKGVLHLRAETRT